MDDDDATRELLMRLCRTWGYQVDEANDGRVALERVRANPPHLVLLDLRMPGSDGFSVLRTMRSDIGTRNIPVIVVSSDGNIDSQIRGMELRADDYISKPFRPAELQSRIRSTLLINFYRNRLLAAEEELDQLRTLDPETGVGSYTHLKAALDAELIRCRRYNHPAVLMILGLGDSPPHMSGEHMVLLHSALIENLRRCLRSVDRLFRFDNHSFVALLPETSAAHLDSILTRLRRSTEVEKLLSNFPDSSIQYGWATLPDPSVKTSEDFLRIAHRAYLNATAKRVRVAKQS